MNTLISLSYLNPVHIHHPIAFILKEFLRKNGIRANTAFLQEKLCQHPHFPSLLSVSDVLTAVDLAHQAQAIEFSDLPKLMNPLIHLNTQRGIFAIVDRIGSQRVRVLTEQGETIEYSIGDFLAIWDGIVIYLKGEPKPFQVIGETYPSYLRYALTALAATASFYFLQPALSSLNLYRGMHLIFGTLGFVLSWVLVLKHYDKNNALFQHLCDGKSEGGCASVLSSKHAYLTPWLTMAEAGLLYFAGVVMLAIFFESSNLLYFLVLMVPFFSLYSIYLQAFIIKHWCKVCLTIHALILFSSGASLLFHEFGLAPSSRLSAEAIIFSTPALGWLLVKPVIHGLRTGVHSRLEYSRLKSNPEIFRGLTTQQPKLFIPDEFKVFVLGNRQATHELTFVSNPICGPCAKAHAVLDQWLKQDIDFKINLIFTYSSAENDSRRAFVERLASLKEPKKLELALHSWFNEQGKDSIAEWADRWDLKPSPLPYDEQSLRKWLGMADVKGTPTFFVNGYRLPEIYQLTDIRFLVTEI